MIFAANEKAGETAVTFTVDASGLAGKDIVVFEEIYCDGVKIAEHKDITDKGQTISFDKPQKPKKQDKPKEEIPKTGDESAVGIYFLLMLFCALGLISALKKGEKAEKKKHNLSKL